jgi:hypothetical protein
MEEVMHGTFCGLVLLLILEALERAEVAPAGVSQIGDRELRELGLTREGLVWVLVALEVGVWTWLGHYRRWCARRGTQGG